MQDNLVDALQLAQCKLLRQQIEGDLGILQLPAQAIKRILEDFGVIKGQVGQMVDRKPANVGSIVSGLHLQTLRVQQGKIDDR